MGALMSMAGGSSGGGGITSGGFGTFDNSAAGTLGMGNTNYTPSQFQNASNNSTMNNTSNSQNMPGMAQNQQMLNQLGSYQPMSNPNLNNYNAQGMPNTNYGLNLGNQSNMLNQSQTQNPDWLSSLGGMGGGQ